MSKNNSFENLDPEELDDSQSSRLLKDSTNKIDPTDIPFCGCLSVRYYQPYFDVDTVDIYNRLSNSLFFCRREQNFMTLIGDKPDAYGPFWISTTLVFTVAVASHLNGWFTSWMKGNIWEYNFQSVLTASSLIFSFAAFAPAAIWFVFKQYDQKLKFVTILCLYGYSLGVFLPAVLFCLIPSEFASWTALFIAATASTVFLLRNLAPIIVTNAQKQAALLLGFVGCIQIIFMLTMKFYFFYNNN